MSKSMELPDCSYPMPKITIIPCAPTPKHSILLSNLDDQMYIRMFVNYMYLFKKSVGLDILKSSLSRVLVDYYPLAGRLRTNNEDENKLEVDCNGEGVVFSEALMDTTAEELLKSSMIPNESWEKLMCEVEDDGFSRPVPPLIIQVTNLCCGGMVLCASISHCVCDGVGAAQFLNAWAHLTKNPNTDLTILPFHERHMLNSRDPPQVKLPHPVFTREPPNPETNFHMWMMLESLVTTSFTFGATEVLRLKKQCMPSQNRITAFEAVAAHTWRSWVKSLNLSPTRVVKLCFTVNFRKKMKLPEGYYGNGFVVACVESTVKDLVVANNLSHCVKLVQQAKASVDDEEYIRSTIDLLKDKTVMPDDSISLLITQWSKLGLEDVDFGEGKPLHLGPCVTSYYCVFLPVIGDPNAVSVLFSVPTSVVESFEYHMMAINSWEKDEQYGGVLTQNKDVLTQNKDDA